MLRKNVFGLIAILFVVAAFAMPAVADTYYWVGANDGDYGVLTNWNTVQGGGGSNPPSIQAGDIFIINVNRAQAQPTTINPFPGTLYANGGTGTNGDLRVLGNSNNPTPSDLHLNGGDLYMGGAGNSSIGSVLGNLSVDSSSTITRGSDWFGYFTIGSVVSGSGDVLVNSGGFTNGGIALTNPGGANPDNSHSGTWTVASGSRLYIMGANSTDSIGTAKYVLNGNAKLVLDNTANADWTVTNDFGGGGSTAATITVETGDGAKKITATGSTITPGTSIGKLQIDGDLDFAPTGGGVYPKLVIEVSGAGGVAGVDFDQLIVDHDVFNIGNLDLVVNSSVPVFALNQQSLTVLSAPNTNFTGLSFHSIQWNGAQGSPVFANGHVDLFFQVVPEPAGLFSLVGLALLALKRRRS